MVRVVEDVAVVEIGAALAELRVWDALLSQANLHRGSGKIVEWKVTG